VEHPTFKKIPELCVKIIRRVNDEDGIRKLVMEVFQNMWFSPVREDPLDTSALLRKVSNITDVVASCEKFGLDFFEQLLLSVSFFPSPNRKAHMLKSSRFLYTVKFVNVVIQAEGRQGRCPGESNQSGASQNSFNCFHANCGLFGATCPAIRRECGRARWKPKVAFHCLRGHAAPIRQNSPSTFDQPCYNTSGLP